DKASLQSLATWASKLPTKKSHWEDDELTEPPSTGARDQETFDSVKTQTLKQYLDMVECSPVSTLDFAATLVSETRTYLQRAHLHMHGLTVFQDGDYHRWARGILKGWSGPIHGLLMVVKMLKDNLDQEKGWPIQNALSYKPVPPHNAPSKGLEDLRQLRDKLNDLPLLLLKADKVLIPQLVDIRRMAETGRMWAPKMVDLHATLPHHRPDGYIKVLDKHGHAADIFVPASTDFKNDAEMRSRIRSPIQVQWVLLSLPDGSHQAIPDLEIVAMPTEVWHTVARVYAMLQPHAGRQSDIKDILDLPRYHSDGYWLEKRTQEFFRRYPGKDPVKLFADRVQVHAGKMDLNIRTLELSSQQGTVPLHNEEVMKEETRVLALEWQEEQRSNAMSAKVN
ncbi:hypothetical protein BFJ63_vAg19740, partial [Fusarium oxysporum f. sp. narcissi]